MINNKDDGLDKLHKEFINRPFRTLNCRCHIIKMPEEMHFTYAIKYLINEYLEECKQNLWIN